MIPDPNYNPNQKTASVSPTQLLNAASKVKSGSNFFSGFSSPTTQGGFSSLNQFGNNYLGTGLPGAEGALTGSTLSGILSGAGVGSIVGAFNPLVQNSTGGSIGGGVGGAIGQAIIPVPIVGGLVGGLIGSTLGGMIGGKPHPATSFDTVLGDGGSYGDLNIKSKHMGEDAATAAAGGLQPYLDVLNKNGINTKGVRVGGGFANGKGYYYLGGTGTRELDPEYRVDFDSNSPDDMKRALKELATKIAAKSTGGQVPQNLNAMLDTVDLNKGQVPSSQGYSASTGSLMNPGFSYNIPQVATKTESNYKWDDFITNYRKNQNSGTV